MRGIDKFKERFAGHDGEYVLIGGGACDQLFGEAGPAFRATKDLDLVLLVEALTPEFGQVFWDFVKEGGYENRQKSSRKPQFYRFSKPEDPAFPAMLELFARTDVDLRDAESGLMPIHIDDEVSSLSAILLDEEYYRMLVENRTSAGGVAVLSVEGLIPFKAKAWLDLSARRAARSASRPEACAHRPARASSAVGCTSITATSRNPRPSSSGSVIRRPAPSSAWKPARPLWATRPRPVPCMYRPPRSARPSATDRP